MNITKYLMGMLIVVAALALAGCDGSKGGAPHNAETKANKDTGKDKDHGNENDKEHGTENEKGLKLTDDELKTAGVVTEELKQQTLFDHVVVTATIRANQDRIAHVAPRVSARIVRVSANLGEPVKKGQMLAQLDSIELGEAHSAYRQAQSQFALAKSDFERAQRLKNEDIIAEKDFLRYRSEYEKARASLRAASDKLRLLDVTHDGSEEGAASVFPLKAPFAGTVIEKDAVLGELAQPDKSIFTVADLSTLWIEGNLFEKDLGRVKIGSPATVAVSAYPNEVFKGKLTYISSTVDKETRTVQARVELPNDGARLKPEMFATVAIDSRATRQAIAVEQDAVLLVNGQATLFVKKGDVYEPRAVELGDKVGSRVIVKGGIKEGELVAVKGAYALKARLLKSQIGDSH